ncbi:hypothetical protein [Nocardiopsis oceani]
MTAGTAALMLIPGVGFWAALGWSSLAAGAAASGRDLADTLRHGTPADLLLAGTVMVLGGRLRGLGTPLSRSYRQYGLGSLPRGFTSLPGNRHQSPAGLVYGPGGTEGHRLKHVLEHNRRNPNKPRHTRFRTGGDGQRALELVDQAWRNRGRPVRSQGGRDVYEIDMGRRVGTSGERHIQIVVDQGTSEIVTAFPFKR